MEMTRNLKYLLAALLFVSTSGPVAAQSLAQAAALARKGPAIAPAFRADIEKLMELTGASAAAAEMASTVSDVFLEGLEEETKQSLPPRVIEVVREVLGGEFVKAFNGSEVKDQLIALYAKYFTHEDVKGMIAFYQSDVGRKSIANLPSLTNDGAAIGERWGRANMPRVMQVLETRLKAEGLMPANASLR
jgi:hypothetical protein